MPEYLTTCFRCGAHDCGLACEKPAPSQTDNHTLVCCDCSAEEMADIAYYGNTTPQESWHIVDVVMKARRLNREEAYKVLAFLTD